jgi:hypothetical protein
MDVGVQIATALAHRSLRQDAWRALMASLIFNTVAPRFMGPFLIAFLPPMLAAD